MGSKGPIAIFIVGIVGMIALGAGAKMLVSESPIAAAAVEFRAELSQRYPDSEVSILGEGILYTVRVTGDSGRDLDATTEATSIGHMLQKSGAIGRRPETVRFVALEPGAACQGPTETARGEYAFEEERRRIRDDIRKFIGAKGKGIDLVVWQSTELQVRRVPPGLPKDKIAEIARRAGKLWGSHWEEIRIVDGKRAHRFSGDGTKPQ